MGHFIRVSITVVFVLALTRMGMGQQLQFEELGKLWDGPIMKLFAASPKTIFAAGSGVFVSTDGGVNWQQSSIPSSRVIKQLSDGRIIGITYQQNGVGFLWSSDDIGKTWTKTLELTSKGPPLSVDIEELANHDVLISIDDSVLYVPGTLDSFTNITPPYPGDPSTHRVFDIHVTESNDVYMSLGSTIFRSSNNGSTWDSVANFYDYSLNKRVETLAIKSSGDTLYSIRARYLNKDKGVFMSVDGGRLWERIGDDAQLPNSWDNELVVTDSEVHVYSLEGIHIQSRQNGTWEYYPLSVDPADIQLVNGNYFVCSRYFGVMESTDRGVSWNYRNKGISTTRYRELLVQHDTIYHLKEWVPPNYSRDMNNDLCAHFAVTYDNGNTWTYDNLLSQALDDSGLTNIFSMTASDTKVFFSAYRKLFILDKQTSTRKAIDFPVTPFTTLYHRASNTVVLFMSNRTLYSNHGGQDEFTEIQLPDSLEAGSMNFFVPMGSTSTPNRIFLGGAYHNGAQTTPHMYEFDPGNDSFALLSEYCSSGIVNSRGHIITETWTSRNNGQSQWRFPLDSLELPKSVGIDANDIFYVGTTKRLIYSTNSGVTWEDSGFPYPVARMYITDEGVLYVDADEYGLYKTTPNIPYVVSAPELEAAPSGIVLAQNYPNPVASGSTTIAFNIAQQSEVTVTLYNALGAKVAEMFSGTVAPGTRTFSFNTSSLAPGMYRYVLHTPTGMQSRWMTVVR